MKERMFLKKVFKKNVFKKESWKTAFYLLYKDISYILKIFVVRKCDHILICYR